MIKMSCKAHNLIRLFIVFIFFSAFNFSKSFAQLDGKKIFKANCASCHTITDQKLIGPGLKGVTQRWPDRQKLYSWIKNSQEYLKTGDSYANQLFEQYNKIAMGDFSNLSNEQIDALIKYIEEEPVKNTLIAKSDAKTNPVKQDSVSLYYLLAGIIAAFILIIVFLRNLKRTISKIVAEKNGLEVETELSGYLYVKKWVNKYKTFVIIVLIVIFVFVLKTIWNSLLGVGVYEGYVPEQPINFSHKIHAGDNKINCVYCHSGAEKSRNAGIPSANVCMNCHKGIQEGSSTGKTEIAKIYAALDYDPATQTYGNNPKPIRWVKIHNLPDLAYFNHSQHVVVGGVACQTCHGEVEKQDVLSQHAPLTMSWCIDCHRKTEVKMKGNEYYDEIYNRLSEELKSTFLKDGKITVDELGGLECSKCHY